MALSLYSSWKTDLDTANVLSDCFSGQEHCQHLKGRTALPMTSILRKFHISTGFSVQMEIQFKSPIYNHLNRLLFINIHQAFLHEFGYIKFSIFNMQIKEGLYFYFLNFTRNGSSFQKQHSQGKIVFELLNHIFSSGYISLLLYHRREIVQGIYICILV